MWDDELERMTNYVTDIFGEEAFDTAVTRALAAMKAEMERSGRPIVAEGGELRGSAMDSASFYEALRAELRRLVRPQ